MSGIAQRDKTDFGGNADDNKLIPEWGVDEDDQVIFAGLAVLAALLLVFGWSWWRGDDNGVDDSPLAPAAEAAGIDTDASRGDGNLPIILGGEAGSDLDEDLAGDTDLDAATGTTSVVPLDLAPAVAAAVGGFGIDSSVDGDIAVLDGFIGTTEESAEAEAAAGSVLGVVSVQNNLEILLPGVTAALEGAGVVNAAPTVTGQTATAIGVVGTEADRAPALAAVEAVPGVVAPAIDRLRVIQPDVDAALTAGGVTNPSSTVNGTEVTVRGTVADDAARAVVIASVTGIEGVTNVIDELVVAGSTADALNEILELEPIQFATGSDEILEASFPTLDRVVALLEADQSTSLEIQGYTDTRGSESANQALSQARADAVLAYLTAREIPAGQLTAKGYGETTQFGDTDALNRRVRFQDAAG